VGTTELHMRCPDHAEFATLVIGGDASKMVPGPDTMHDWSKKESRCGHYPNQKLLAYYTTIVKLCGVVLCVMAYLQEKYNEAYLLICVLCEL
jgi:hypothetical protein